MRLSFLYPSGVPINCRSRKKKKASIYSFCKFLWHKYSHHSWFQATNPMSLTLSCGEVCGVGKGCARSVGDSQPQNTGSNAQGGKAVFLWTLPPLTIYWALCSVLYVNPDHSSFIQQLWIKHMQSTVHYSKFSSYWNLTTTLETMPFIDNAYLFRVYHIRGTILNSLYILLFQSSQLP